MKTAMEELIELIENGETELYLIENHKQIWLEREKEQIIDAYNQGTLDGESSMLEYPNYYNQTYNQEPKKEYQPSEKYLKKQRELMEDFIWNKMNKNNQNK